MRVGVSLPFSDAMAVINGRGGLLGEATSPWPWALSPATVEEVALRVRVFELLEPDLLELDLALGGRE